MMLKIKTLFTFLTGAGLIALMAGPAVAGDTTALADVLKKIDGVVCKNPEKLPEFYTAEHVILQDDKRALLKHRVEDYRQMLSDFREMKCENTRKVFTGETGDKVGYLVSDELISVTSKSTDTDERQHSICNYVFTKEGGAWKVALEHCSSLPDYSIRPGEDAHYYYHNPVY